MLRPFDTLEADLAALATMSPAQLRNRWIELAGAPVPRVSPVMLRSALAYELQVRVFGGLSRNLSQTLDQLGAAKTGNRVPRPGMRLTREWSGTVHVVTIREDGRPNWNGRDWRSLSEIARAITGTRWSGPAFFGLRKKADARVPRMCAA